MKRFNLLNPVVAMLMVLMAGFSGCNTEDVDYPRSYLEVSRVVIPFGPDAGEQTFTVTTNRNWTVTFEAADSTWFKFTMSGEAGNSVKGTVSVLPNTGVSRKATLKVTAGPLHEYINITQQGEGGPAEVLLYESVGSTNVSENTDVNAFDGWLKQGTSAATVSYTGSGVTVRTTGASDNLDASGGNNLFFGGSAQFVINEIDITDHDNFTFTFGLSRMVYGTGYVPVDGTTIKLWASIDGNQYAPLTYTCDTEKEGWVLATSEFKVPSSATRLWIKYDGAVAASEVRIDDLTLLSGGNGQMIDVDDPGPGPDPGPGDYLYYESVGSTNVSDKTDIDVFTGWLKDGVAASSVTYSGTPNTTVRTTGESSSYEGASGGNNIFFGGAGHQFDIKTLNISGNDNLTFTFGLSRMVYGTGYVPVDGTTIKLWASIDGNQYAPLTYTCNTTTEGWVLATSEFKVPSGSSQLWIRFDNAIANSEVRIDDFTLAVGGNGQLIDVDDPGPGPGPGEEVIYTENVGTVNVSENTDVNSFTAWNKSGDASTTVNYSAINADVRISGASSGYEGASGGNSILLRAAGHQFVIENLNISGSDNFTFTFGLSRMVYGTGYVPVDGTTIKLWASIDGNQYAPLTYTCNTTTEGWVLATSEFKVPAGSSRLWIKFDNAVAASEVRIDDFTLAVGGNGQMIDVDGGGSDPGPQPTGDIYYESCGTTVSGQVQIADYAGWVRSGTLSQSGVRYNGDGATIRNSGANYEPSDNGFTGAPYVFLHPVSDNYPNNFFSIEDINITGYTSVKFTMAVSYQSDYSGTPVFGTITGDMFNLTYSTDGLSWTPLSYTAPSAAASWVTLTSADINVPAGTTQLHIALIIPESSAGTNTGFRFDDFRVVSNSN